MFGSRRSGSEELTRKDNIKRMAELHSGGTGKHSIWSNRAAYYAYDSPLAQLLRDPTAKVTVPHPAVTLVETFEIASATVEADFRKDVVEAQKAATPQNVGLSLAPASVQVPVQGQETNGIRGRSQG